MTFGSELELENSKKLGEEEIVKRQSEDNLFRKNHGLLGLLDLPVVWWFSKTSVFCLSGHLSAHLLSDLYVLVLTFSMWSEIYKNKAHICWKRHNKKWTFRFFEKSYHVNSLESIFNESSYNFRFLIENPSHIYSGKLLILIYYPKMFSINENAAFYKL